jgi:sec-independent protein translocase protein TatA
MNRSPIHKTFSGRFFLLLLLTEFSLTLPDKSKGMNVSPILLGVLGTQEIIIIAIIILLLFGGRKIPELMRGLGKGIREFNDAKNTVRKEIEESTTETSAENKK